MRPLLICHFVMIFCTLPGFFRSVTLCHAQQEASSPSAWPGPRLFLPEERSVDIRPPTAISPMRAPTTMEPETITHNREDLREIPLGLDEAIAIALENSQVIRVLSGISASSSGRTIYDVAITNTGIDQRRARFDPSLRWRNDFRRQEIPSASLDPLDPLGAEILGLRSDDYQMSASVSKFTATGGTLQLGVNTAPTFLQPGQFALNPQNRHSVDLGFTQPLWRGKGVAVNRAPIVVALLEEERSFFQYKNSVQQLVSGVITAYWNLVLARTEAWARRQQVQQARFAYEQSMARYRSEMVSRGVVAQSRVSLGGFQAALIATRNNVLQREAALRNILGLPPADGRRIVPYTPPQSEYIRFDWQRLLALAENHRPDIIEIKLVTEADEQMFLMAKNEIHPNIDATALYRWNGLEGTTPTGARISTHGGQFTDWTLGVTFSAPLTLRQERAGLRRRELILARDRAFLQQSIHSMTHDLATTLRSLDQLYQQYREYRAILEDARLNLQEKRARWKAGGVGGVSYIEVLLAITDWGNTVNSQAQALTQYNSQLANLELQTGTILEAHGIRFYEERFASIGPLGLLGSEKCYPESVPAAGPTPRYGKGDVPSEQFFELENTSGSSQPSKELPPPGRASTKRPPGFP